MKTQFKHLVDLVPPLGSTPQTLNPNRANRDTTRWKQIIKNNIEIRALWGKFSDDFWLSLFQNILNLIRIYQESARKTLNLLIKEAS